MLPRSNCEKLFHSLFPKLRGNELSGISTLRGRREPTLTQVGTTSARPPGRRSRAAFFFLSKLHPRLSHRLHGTLEFALQHNAGEPLEQSEEGPSQCPALAPDRFPRNTVE